jgi:oligoribonuclease NrnB/cAMP/cGMP phosphodiesterase (DHH superfamily)
MSVTEHQPHSIVYYHNPCQDGVAGAWCAWNYFEEGAGSNNNKPIEYRGCKPDEDMSNEFTTKREYLTGANIYFIDVLPTRDIPALCAIAKQVVILDHHKTNLEYINTIWCYNSPTCQNLTVVFDLERSGAQIAWDYFNPESVNARPWFIDYIGDRDLWTWKLPNSRAINSGLQNQGHLDSLGKFNIFCRENKDKDSSIVMKQMADCGNAIESYQTRIINQAAENAVCLHFNDPKSGIKTQCWMGTITPDLISDLGNTLAEKLLPDGTTPLFSVIYSYYILNDEYRLSLRSSDKNPQAADVSAIAKRMDMRGGGHKHAAGCKVSSAKFWQYFSKRK